MWGSMRPPEDIIDHVRASIHCLPRHLSIEGVHREGHMLQIFLLGQSPALCIVPSHTPLNPSRSPQAFFQEGANRGC